MKILLVSPPTNSDIKHIIGVTGPPAGLAYIASMVRDEHEVKIVDSLSEDFTFDDIRKIIKEFDPRVVGITATTSMIPDAYRVAKIAKEVNKDIFTVIGGPHVTFLPDRTMKECKYIDFVVRGEGENTFKELIDAIEKGRGFKDIKGLSYKKNKVINNPPRELIKNIDEIPIPSYDLLPMKKYKVDRTEFGTVMTSRGCPFQCIFCSSSLQFGKIWRAHSPERVIEELSILTGDYGIREIEFLDDTFTLSNKRAIEISKAIRKEKLDISWSASSRVNTFSREVGREIRKAGCHTLYFGIESGTQKILNFIGKGITLDQSRRAVKDAKNVGLKAFGSFIIGFPDETREEVKKTMKFSRRVGVNYAQFTVATPYPGTRLWYLALREKLLTTMNWRNFTTLTPVLKLKYFTQSQISRLLMIAYARFYIRPKILIRDILEDKGFIIKRLLHTISSFTRVETMQKDLPGF